MNDIRPSSDAVLARVQEDGEPARGKLKIFFGATPGVGNTYAMLSEARDRKAAGTDIVIGVIETHGRADIEALVQGLELLPRRSIDYRGLNLREFDIDGALNRDPQLILVDDLAHTNAYSSRHPKRWQDVQELLQAGIEVYTTLNIQHLESLNDGVTQITGVIVRETVPDTLIEQASEIELVDVSPDELLQRLREDKVYISQQVNRAAQHFFRKGNLLALRELALRRAAYGWATLVVVVCTAIAAGPFSFFELANLVLIYLVGVIFIAVKLGRGPSILASVLSVAAFDFFFLQPYLTFAVSDVQYVWTLGVMLTVALVISALTTQLRQRAEAASIREKRTAALYAMSRDFASVRSLDHVLRAAVQHLSETFDSQVVILLPTGGKRLQPWGKLSGWWGDKVTEKMIYAPDDSEISVAQWVFDHGELAGLGTNILPSAQALYLPLKASRGSVGVLGVRPTQVQALMTAEQQHLIETFANQAGLAFERTFLAEEAQQAQVQAETERMRASLLSSVSHDLRTPLAAITGASSSLLQGGTTLPEAVRIDLIQAINDESVRLSRLVSNLLDMTRIEAKTVQVAKEWQPLEEVVGAALGRLEKTLASHQMTVHLPRDLPPVPIDSVLIEQVFINLLENAVHYTPPDSVIKIDATASSSEITVRVSDNGPGIPSGDEQRVFEKFYRASTAKTGAGLGLAICQGIVAAHGGRIWIEQQAAGGTLVSFALPLDRGELPPLPET